MADLLDADLIHRALSDRARQRLAALDVLDVVPSTNTWLLQQPSPSDGQFSVVLAEHQTAGRGRNEKRWFSPPGSGLCLSVGCAFGESPPQVACLTLAAGVAVVRGLESVGASDLCLKWPNDLYASNAKLGGILTDAQTRADRRLALVCGVGINVDLSLAGEGMGVDDYSITDLRCHADELPSRSVIAAAVIDRLVRAITQFTNDGLKPFRADWNRYDWLRGKPVDVQLPDGELVGIADGIDDNGALRVMTEHGRRRVFTGTVRVRPESAP